MKVLAIIGGFVCVLACMLQGWWWLTVLFTALFTFFDRTILVVLAAVFYDAYLGAFYAVPVLSMAAVGWYLITASMRPWVRTLR